MTFLQRFFLLKKYGSGKIQHVRFYGETTQGECFTSKYILTADS